MMELVGQHDPVSMAYSKTWFSSELALKLAALGFGGNTGAVTAATEEWTGAGSPTTVTITAS
jgi:hypothetical protein